MGQNDPKFVNLRVSKQRVPPHHMPPLPEPASHQEGPNEAGPARTRVWDLPTRLYHWALACAVVGQIATGFGDAIEWHFRLGYAVLTLLLFRLAWGFVGGRWSRFSSFTYAPASVLAYLGGRAHPDHVVGHSPLGALSVFGVLIVLAIQVATGLLADDEVASAGPLSRFVSGATVSAATFWHSEVGKWIVVTLVGLHVLAVLFYVLVRHQPLVRAMIAGDKEIAMASEDMSSRDDVASRLWALLIFMACACLAAWISSLRI